MRRIDTIEDLLWAEKIGQWRAEERAEYRRQCCEEGNRSIIERLRASGMLSEEQAAVAMGWNV